MSLLCTSEAMWRQRAMAQLQKPHPASVAISRVAAAEAQLSSIRHSSATQSDAQQQQQQEQQAHRCDAVYVCALTKSTEVLQERRTKRTVLRAWHQKRCCSAEPLMQRGRSRSLRQCQQLRWRPTSPIRKQQQCVGTWQEFAANGTTLSMTT
ncbi:hypothetical protein JKP88DRAFT_189938, partial [Tribonema minus]